MNRFRSAGDEHSLSLGDPTGAQVLVVDCPHYGHKNGWNAEMSQFDGSVVPGSSNRDVKRPEIPGQRKHIDLMDATFAQLAARKWPAGDHCS